MHRNWKLHVITQSRMKSPSETLRGFERFYFIHVFEELTVSLENSIFLWNGTMWSWFHKHNWSSGNRAMCARPVQGVSSHYSSIQTLELERTATRTCTAGCFQQHSWDPACAPAPPETGGSRSQQAAHSTHGSLTGLFIFSHVVFYSKSPWHDTWRSTHSDLVSNAPSDQGLAAQWCPLRSFSRAALGKGRRRSPPLKHPVNLQRFSPLREARKDCAPLISTQKHSGYPDSLES